jgi:hypothetical protein
MDKGGEREMNKNDLDKLHNLGERVIILFVQ